QFSIGRLSPIRWAYHEWGGKYIEDGAMLYVSLGLGGTVPFRLGAWPEINLIELKCAKL
ncbi:MAG: metallophosphoesterase, partial [Prevotella sp.]